MSQSSMISIDRKIDIDMIDDLLYTNRQPRCLVVIPFRSESGKHLWRIPNSDTTLLDNMIRKTRFFDTLVCSDTPSEDIEQTISFHRQWRRSELLLTDLTYVQRPPELATSSSPIFSTIRWLINHLCLSGTDIIHLCQLTSPLLDPTNLIKACEIFATQHVNSVQTIAKVQHNSHYLNQRDLDPETCRVRRHHPMPLNNNRQGKPPSYIFGNLYSFLVEPALRVGHVMPDFAYGIEIPYEHALDIQTISDMRGLA